MPLPQGTRVRNLVIGLALPSPRGELYRARHTELARELVIRVLRSSDYDREHTQHLLREAALASRVSHPNVVGVFDAFVSEGDSSASQGDVYLVLEDLGGVGLEAFLERQGWPSTEIALRIALELARGIDELRRAGVFVTDLHPRNLTIARGGCVKLSGLAEASCEVEDPLPPLSSASPYVAPERAAGLCVTPEASVYALAALLHLLLTGTAPENGSLIQLPRIRRGLCRVVRSSLSRAPAHRPLLREFLNQLELSLPDPSPARCRREIAELLDQTAPLAQLEAEPAASPGESSELQGGPAREGRAPPETSTEGEERVPRTASWRIPLPLAVAGGTALILLSALLFRAFAGDPATPPTAPDVTPAAVVFHADPWAEVLVSGHEPFLTPRARPLELQPGRHVVEFRHPTLGVARRTLRVLPGEQRIMLHRFVAESET